MEVSLHLTKIIECYTSALSLTYLFHNLVRQTALVFCKIRPKTVYHGAVAKLPASDWAIPAQIPRLCKL